jgi:lipooligosaccharide transport system permease protein
VRFSPLYHAIELMRSLTLGTVAAASVVHLAYLVLLGTVGMAIARRRMAGLLLS